ncbi:MAG: putative dsRNA-binding protein [Alphaproteobacteria bacterium]
MKECCAAERQQDLVAGGGAQQGLGNPVYEVVGRAGSEHEPTFFMTVSLRGIKSQQGEGRNKKLAEQAAAAKMLDFLGYPHGTKC